MHNDPDMRSTNSNPLDLRWHEVTAGEGIQALPLVQLGCVCGSAPTYAKAKGGLST